MCQRHNPYQPNAVDNVHPVGISTIEKKIMC